MAEPESDDLDDFEPLPRRPPGRGQQWESVAAGARVVQLGYAIACFCFGVGTLLIGPHFWLDWPKALGWNQRITVPEEEISLLLLYPAMVGLLAGLFLVLLGQALCSLSPTRLGRVIAWAAVLLLLGGVFAQTVQSALPHMVERRSVGSSSYEIMLLLLRAVALGANLLSHYLLVVYVKYAAAALPDRTTSRLASLCLGLFPIYFLVTVALYALGLGLSMEARQGNLPQIFRESGTLPMVLFFGWCFLGLFVALLLLVLLQQFRQGISRHMQAPRLSLLPPEEARP